MAPNYGGSNTSITTHPRTKVTSEQVKKFLTSKKTIQEVASNFGVTTATARKHVVALANSKLVKKVGTKAQPDGQRGRPADLYAQA